VTTTFLLSEESIGLNHADLRASVLFSLVYMVKI
jgi:hypothetical protein